MCKAKQVICGAERAEGAEGALTGRAARWRTAAPPGAAQ